LRKIETIDDDPFAKIMIPSFIKFFGNIAIIHPSKIFNGYPKVVDALFECLLSEDYTILPISYDTLGHLGRSNEGKKYLNSVVHIKKALKSLGTSIKNMPTDLKIRILNCLHNLFDVEGNTCDNQVTCITQSWYDCLADSQEHLNFIMTYCKNPFPDIRVAALGLLKAVCTHKWGQEYMKNSGGFIEYLLDRKVDFDINAIQEKYEVVKVLAVSTVFDAQQIVELRKYVADGAFYKETITEVAIEGGD
jgi:26S proteasome non-ATPase regulatory subunit 5